MEESLRRIEQKIEELGKEIAELKIICSRMDKHISFVETVYDKFSTPLHLMKQKIESVFGKQQAVLKQ
jgi:hypothetical protein